MFRSPLFAWSPRPDQDLEATPVSQTSSRFAAFRLPRTIFNGSSVYSQSPALENATTPKVPSLGFWQRQQSSDPPTLTTPYEAPRESSESASPFRTQHFAGPYIGTIADPQESEDVYTRHPADVQLPYQQDSHENIGVHESTEDVPERRHRKKHRRRRHTRRNKQFVRRRDERSTSIVSASARATAARGKTIACIISGIFLVTVLAIYLAIALTHRDLGQEIHILFIMILLAITIFFCHSLIRLCMLLLNPPRRVRRAPPHMLSMTGPDGFQPIVPIRVHLARDEEAHTSDHPPESDTHHPDPEEKEILAPPPPAYGLWRSSVRANPNLLHWQPAHYQSPSLTPTIPSHFPLSLSSPSSIISTLIPQPNTPQPGPRPPSYVSEDGTSYVSEPAPLHTLYRQSRSGVSDIHPAWRPGYVASPHEMR